MRCALLLLGVFSPLPALAVPCVAANFPTDSWPSRAAEVREAKKTQIAALEELAFTLVGKDSERLGQRTDALLIIKGGQIVYEKYARGWDEGKIHISWSVAKSVTSALIGRAVQQGLLELDQSICQVLPNQPEAICKITVHHLLEFSSGLDWQEEYEDQSYQVSSVIAMLFGEGHRDVLSFITRHRSYAEPGVKWRYSTGEATLLSAVAKLALQPKHGKDWAWHALFDVIGMRGVTFEEDEKGTPLGGSHLFATARDYARIGYLYLHDGCWNGTRLLPEDWVKRSTEPSPSFISSAGPSETLPNGWMWWLNKVAGDVKEKPWKDAPGDAYSAIGHWGQFIVVVPSEDVVIVRTGDDRQDGISLARLIPLSLEVAR